MRRGRRVETTRQPLRFKGESWERFGDVISSDVGG